MCVCVYVCVYVSYDDYLYNLYRHSMFSCLLRIIKVYMEKLNNTHFHPIVKIND